MKKYLLGFSAIVLAIGFSAFTKPVKPAFATHFFKFMGDPTISSQVLDLTKYTEENPSTCPSSTEIACSITVIGEAFSHTVVDGDDTQEVLNTSTNNPDNESILTLSDAVGYTDVAPDPDVNYYKLLSNTGYTPVNRAH